MLNKPLKTLFYGLTPEHAPGKWATLAKMRDTFEIVAVADDRPRGSFAYLDRPIDTAGFRVVGEDEALALADVDVAIVETSNRDLMDVAAKLADRGIPMHCDKPCGEAMEPYRSIVETCRAKNLPFQIGYMYRGNPAVRLAWRAMEEGWLGELAFVEADMNHDYSLANYPAYISTFKKGLLYNLGSHLVDMIYPAVKGRTLDAAVPVIGDAPGDQKGCGTSGASLMRFGNLTALVRMCAHMPGSIGCRRMRVDGTNGTLEIRPIERFDGKSLTLELTLKEGAGGYGPGTHVVDFGVQEDRYAPQLADLAAIVRGDKPNDQDYERDLRVHELFLRACGL